MNLSMRSLLPALLLASLLAAAPPALETARNKQDLAALNALAAAAMQAASQAPNNLRLQIDAALAFSYLSEVALELRDKRQARSAAESGLAPARAALSLDPNSAEAHRLLGTLCGQVIPADPLAGIKHGRCAKEEIETALKLDPKSPTAWLASGIGKYYLPPMFGGGVPQALEDFQKAASLAPKSHEPHLWLGLAHRKLNHNAEARAAFQKSLAVNPGRLWTKQQLEKTPAQ
jgi:hypothetical protein